MDRHPSHPSRIDGAASRRGVSASTRSRSVLFRRSVFSTRVRFPSLTTSGPGLSGPNELPMFDSSPEGSPTPSDRSTLLDAFRETRRRSEWLCEPLEIEDYGLQSMTEASPPKWHLAHTTWFFEVFVLARDDSYAPFHPDYEFLFNS